MVTGGLKEVAQKVKEEFCYCCKDPMKEFEKYDEKGTDNNGKPVQSSKFKHLKMKTRAGVQVEVDVGYERFLAPEMFFHPVS